MTERVEEAALQHAEDLLVRLRDSALRGLGGTPEYWIGEIEDSLDEIEHCLRGPTDASDTGCNSCAALDALEDLCELISMLAEQQAMPDDWYAERLRSAREALAAARGEIETPAQEECKKFAMLLQESWATRDRLAASLRKARFEKAEDLEEALDALRGKR